MSSGGVRFAIPRLRFVALLLRASLACFALLPVTLNAGGYNKQAVVYWRVSDFEKSLHTQDSAACERLLGPQSELLVNGALVSGCKNLMQQQSRPYSAGRLKLRNAQFEFNDREAHVTVDVAPSGEHHQFVLREIGDQWTVTSFSATRSGLRLPREASNRSASNFEMAAKPFRAGTIWKQ